jgi:hypothetical protein
MSVSVVTAAHSLVLFLHVAVALATFGVAAVQHFALGRMVVAPSVAELRWWGRTLAGRKRLLPLGSAALMATGLYLTGSAWTWTTGWVDLSIAAVILVNVIGARLIGPRMARFGAALAVAADGPPPPAVRRALTDPVLWSATHANTGLVFAITFLMTAKPPLPVAAAALVTGAALGAAAALPFWRRPTEVAAPAPAAAAA